MRKLTSANAFKTSYVAEIKEELGLKSRIKVAPNRRGPKRRVRTPLYLKRFIFEAIGILSKETGKVPTYKQIQQKAFELYKDAEKNFLVDKYYGFLKTDDRDFIRNIVEDEKLYYES